MIKPEDMTAEWQDGYCEGLKKGRTEGIDRFSQLLLKHKSKDEYPVICVDEWTIKRFVEQLKEQKNE